jgi:hypothetical protein
MTTFNKNNEVIKTRKQVEKEEKRKRFKVKFQKFVVVSILVIVLLSAIIYGIYSAGIKLGDWIADEFIVVSYDQKLNN